MKVCLIGGGGFIGVNFARSLVEKEASVAVFGHRSRFAADLAGCTQHIAAFTDTDALARAVEGCDVVVHLIGRFDGLRRASLTQDTPDDGTARATARLLALGAEGRYGRLLFLSSGGTVYGVPTAVPLGEDSPQWPVSAYGVDKLALERTLHAHHHVHGLDYRIARVSNPFGPYQVPGRGQGVVAKMVDCARTGTPFPMMGDGGVIRDYFAVDDLSEALWRLARMEGPERVFNVGSGVGRSVKEMLTLVEQATGRRLTVAPLPPRPQDAPANILDISRARRVLGWQPAVPLEEGLRRTLAWQEAALPLLPA